MLGGAGRRGGVHAADNDAVNLHTSTLAVAVSLDVACAASPPPRARAQVAIKVEKELDRPHILVMEFVDACNAADLEPAQARDWMRSALARRALGAAMGPSCPRERR